MAPETLRDLRRYLKGTSEVSSLVPFEAKWSYPIPTIKEGQVRLRFLVYSIELAPEKLKIKFYPPFQCVEATLGTDRKVEIINIKKTEEKSENPFVRAAQEAREGSGSFEENLHPLGETPPPCIRSLSYEARVQLREEFYSIIERVLPFVGKQQISQQDVELVQKYRTYFELLVEPEMQVEYRKISPEFFEWLDRVPR